LSDSDPQSPTNDEANKGVPTPAAGVEEGSSDEGLENVPEMSPEDVDAFFAEESPEFALEIAAIGNDKSLTLGQIDEDDKEALNEEVERWKNRKGILKTLLRIVPFIPWLSVKLKYVNFLLKFFVIRIFIHLKNFGVYLVKDGKQKGIGDIKKLITRAGKLQNETSKNFKKLNRKAKLILFSSFLLLCLGIFVIYRSLTHGLFPADKDMFLMNLADHANQSYDYDPKETEAYLDNTRAFQNVFLTQKIVANLKRVDGPDTNPMGMFEFFIEGMSAEVLVEIKDREPFMRDLMQRTIEDMTFEELDTDVGKRDLCQRIQKAISQQLSTGTVKGVRIHTIIIKP
jgi:flagellar basal body-associated protein FliL